MMVHFSVAVRIKKPDVPMRGRLTFIYEYLSCHNFVLAGAGLLLIFSCASRPFPSLSGAFFVWPPLGTFRVVRLTHPMFFPVLMRRTEGEADAVVGATVRRRKVETVGDTAERRIVVPAAAAQHAVGARTWPCWIGLR